MLTRPTESPSNLCWCGHWRHQHTHRPCSWTHSFLSRRYAFCCPFQSLFESHSYFQLKFHLCKVARNHWRRCNGSLSCWSRSSAWWRIYGTQSVRKREIFDEIVRMQIEMTNYQGSKENRKVKREALISSMFPATNTFFINDLESTCYGVISLSEEGVLGTYFKALWGKETEISLHPGNCTKSPSFSSELNLIFRYQIWLQLLVQDLEFQLYSLSEEVQGRRIRSKFCRWSLATLHSVLCQSVTQTGR